jgi:membrane protease YdiL (CAAX protease family)
LRKSQTPLTSLLFLLPLLVLYEVGTHYFATDFRYHTETRIRAFDYMLRFFRLFGASGKYLPALAVGMILLCWHIARKDPWDFDFGAAGCMVLESVALSLPLFAMDALCKGYVPLRAARHVEGQWPEMIVLSIGAGVYEELVFRLGAFTLLSILFVDLLQIPRFWSLLLIVVGSAMLFASYHYQGGTEAFAWQTFVFRTGAGIYFGLLFFIRGFGITAGSHAAYDILAVLLPALTTR